MKRLELFVVALVACLAAFVGVQAGSVRVHATTEEGSVGAMRPDAGKGSASARPLPATAPSPEMEPAPDRMRVRSRLADGSTGTYMSEVLQVRDSSLARWPDRRNQPLRVWVQDWNELPHFQTSFVPLVQAAFDDWASTGIPLRFTFVRDSASAEIHVTWVDRFPEPISGKTLWAHDDDWWIVEANIMLALHHNNGDPLDSHAVRAIALHEVGHLIGLDHTADTTAIMTPKVRVKELQPMDRATARLLYSLPPGSVR
jgi:hypothetical protein